MNTSRASEVGHLGQQGVGLGAAPVLAERLGQGLGLIAGLGAEIIVLAGPAQREQPVDGLTHPARVLGLLGQVDRHDQGFRPVRDLLRGLIQQRADAIEKPFHVHRIGDADQEIGVVGPLGQVGRVIQGGLDIGRRAVIHLDRDRQRFIHPGLGFLAVEGQIGPQGGIDVPGLAALIQERDGLAKRPALPRA